MSSKNNNLINIPEARNPMDNFMMQATRRSVLLKVRW